MAHTSQDKTLIDNNRRDLSFRDRHSIREVLPEYFSSTYPKFLSFLEAYYEFEHDPISPAHLIHELFESKDISATDIKLLNFIEDELLLGEQYFQGFQDKRAAAKVSNVLYRSKGTLFSMQQFFRMFYGLNPDIEYPKKYIFTVGESEIGSESQRFILNDKIYQQYAILIKIGLPISEWRDTYKLFVHPAGMYLGAEVQLFGLGDVDLFAGQAVFQDVPALAVHSTGTVTTTTLTEISGIVVARGGIHGDTYDDTLLDSEYSVARRVEVTANFKGEPNYGDLTIEQLDRIYDDVGEAAGRTSPTFDEDSAGVDFRVARLSSTLDTFDEVYVPVWDPLDRQFDSDLPIV